MALPRCGLYRTTTLIGSIPAGRLVYFHNHGNPGPGVYLPRAWKNNRAEFDEQGTTLADEATAHTLDPLAPEGLYRVEHEFTCCEKKCRVYKASQLVQLGYDGAGQPILFVPEWTPHGLAFPERGHFVDGPRLARLSRLLVSDADLKTS
jgi:hypothetical protein